MSELTDAENVTLESATYTNLTDDYSDDRTDEVEANRWQKKGDRLYINSPAKWEKNSTYFDLVAGEMQDLPGSRDVTVERDGNTVTITVADTGGIGYDEEWTIVLELEFADDGDDEDEAESESEPEIVADGGEDVTEHVDDETIEDAIAQHDAPDHPDSTTVEEVRDALAWLQQSMEEVWSDWLSNIENEESEVVYEDNDVIVFATGEQNVPRRDLREHYDGDLNERTPDVVSAVHHALARDLCDYDWGYEYPLVVRKGDGVEDGQRYVEAVINSLLRRDLSPGQAWAYYGVEIRGNSRNKWATRCGYSDHSAVSEAVRKAKSKLP